MKKIGGKVVFDDNFNRVSTIVLQKEGKETWVEVRSYNNMYRLTTVEKETMKQEVVANAEVMGSDINATGHVSIYGIYFDTGKSEIKPESDAALSEIAKLLENDGTLKVYVVGHTGQCRIPRFQHETFERPGGRGGKDPDRQTRNRRNTPAALWCGLPFARRAERHRGGNGEEPTGGIGQAVIARNRALTTLLRRLLTLL